MDSVKKNDRQGSSVLVVSGPRLTRGSVESSPFEGVQKGLVLHEARIFNDQQLNARSCSRVLTKILYLLCQGEKFTSDEATAVFFGTTKLFQSNNVRIFPLLFHMVKFWK
jgi:coatomer subunit gamma